MKKEAYADTTIGAVGSRLRYLTRNCILSKPEVVKCFIANKNCSTTFKESLIEAYDLYCRANNIAWSKPFYQRYDKLPKIPTEEKLNMIISNASRKFTLILSMMKDLGTRPIELTWLKVRDLDLETGLVNVTSAKHCIGRTLKLKTQMLALLKT
jgi:integrase